MITAPNHSAGGPRRWALALALVLAAALVTPAEAMMKRTPGGKNNCGPDGGCGGGPGGQTPGGLAKDVAKGFAAPVKAYKPLRIGRNLCSYPPSTVPMPCP